MRWRCTVGPRWSGARRSADGESQRRRLKEDEEGRQRWGSLEKICGLVEDRGLKEILSSASMCSSDVGISMGVWDGAVACRWSELVVGIDDGCRRLERAQSAVERRCSVRIGASVRCKKKVPKLRDSL